MRTECKCLTSPECAFVGLWLQEVHKPAYDISCHCPQELHGLVGWTDLQAESERSVGSCASDRDISATDFRAVLQGQEKWWGTVASPGQAGVRPRKQK